MSKRIITIVKHIKPLDPRLKRHVRHDSRSRRFVFDTSGLTIQSKIWNRNIAILDQGQIGDCTANAGIGLLGTDPFFKTLPVNPKYSLDETGAIALYNDEENQDGDGPYPPNDNGSSGITCATVLLAAKLISGYRHTFTADDALKAISQGPGLLGINWYNSMMTPAADGKLTIGGGGIAGGHEILIREIDAPNERVWIDNSWSSSWGISGRAYLSFKDFETLLGEDGDVTLPTPLSQAAPVPKRPESWIEEMVEWFEEHV